MTCMQLSSIGWIWYVHEALLAVVSIPPAPCLFQIMHAMVSKIIFARLQTHCMMARVHSNWLVHWHSTYNYELAKH